MATLRIVQSAIENNIRAIRAHTDKRIIAVVKEDGYGVGLRSAYRLYHGQGIDFFAVATPWEALQMTEMAEPSESILLLTPVDSVEACAELAARGVIFMLGSSEQADILRQAGGRAHCVPRVHLAIDTGLGRYGYIWSDVSAVPRDVQGLKVEGVYTHFATQTRDVQRSIQRQFSHFKQALEVLRALHIDPGMTHACASLAFACMGDLGCDAIRVGSLLLGRCAGPLQNEFENAVYLEAEISRVTERRCGEYIGYDGYRLRRDVRVGLVRVGYADGAFLSTHNDADGGLRHVLRSVRTWLRGGRTRSVSVAGKRIPVIGKIGMNHMLLDLTGASLLGGAMVRIEVNPILVRREIPRCFL